MNYGAKHFRCHFIIAIISGAVNEKPLVNYFLL